MPGMKWQRYGECRTFAEFALDGDIAFEQIDQPLDDAETEAGAGKLTAVDTLGHVKGVENVRQVRCRDADAAVGHRPNQPTLVFNILRPDAQLHGAALGVFD